MNLFLRGYLARANHELQNYGLVKNEFDELRGISPELANQFAYLLLQGEESTRSAEASQAASAMLWEEEK